MAEIAAAYPDGVPSIREIAEKQQVSAKYLEHIMQGLKAAGLVRAIRGTHGGYVLARPPEQITMKEIYQALEGSAAPVPCVDEPTLCDMVGSCPTRDAWVEMKQAIEEVLGRRTLRDLARKCSAGAGGRA